MRFLAVCMAALLLVACGQESTIEAPTATATPMSAATAVPAVVFTPTPLPEYAQIPGIYLGRFHGTSSPSTVLEEAIGKGAAISLYYSSWQNGVSSGVFRTDRLTGRLSYITWEYQSGAATDLQAILEGEHDDHIDGWAARIGDLEDQTIMLRWGHEMNGDWYPWSGVANGGGTLDGFGDPAVADGPERYVAAYRYIHERFAETGADNVLWVWCPNAPIATMTAALGEWNDAAHYYPGDAYVDWLCLDGYNWGSSTYGQTFNSRWSSFDEIFAESYQQLQAINDEKPMMIGEFASTEEGGDKAAWITATYQTIAEDYPQIRAVTWFHINKETDWRIDSSPESLAAFKTAVSSNTWLDQWPYE
ncbi:MAG: glycosyl hydrolase [Chloroflexota bacterium]